MLNPPPRKEQTKGLKKVCDLHQKRLRLVDSHLFGSELIFNFLIVNRLLAKIFDNENQGKHCHKLSLHFRKRKSARIGNTSYPPVSLLTRDTIIIIYHIWIIRQSS